MTQKKHSLGRVDGVKNAKRSTSDRSVLDLTAKIQRFQNPTHEKSNTIQKPANQAVATRATAKNQFSEPLGQLLIAKSLKSPFRSSIFLRAIIKNLMSPRFFILICLPFILANVFWFLSVDLRSIESTLRHWLNPAHYSFVATILGVALLLCLVYIGLQSMFFLAGVSQSLVNQQARGRSLWFFRYANRRFFRQLGSTILFSFGVLIILIALAALSTWALGSIDIPPHTDVYIGLLVICIVTTIVLAAFYCLYRLSQIIVNQSPVGIWRGWWRSLYLFVSHPLSWLAELSITILSWLGIGLVWMGAGVGIYWCLTRLSGQFFVQTLCVFVIIFMAMLVFSWVDMFNWQQWANYCRWLSQHKNPNYSAELVVNQKGAAPVKSYWQLFTYLGLIGVSVVVYISCVSAARPALQRQMQQIQQHLPDSNQRLIPSSRGIRYNVE